MSENEVKRFKIDDLPHDMQDSPVFKYSTDNIQFLSRLLWFSFIKVTSQFNVRFKVHGSWEKVYRNHPKLLVISNHASHLDAVAISGTIPFKMWSNMYMTAAKDYFFSNRFMKWFSRYCLAAIPMDRHDRKKDSVQMVLTLLSQSRRAWVVLFPEGTRSKTGKIGTFKKGVSIFSQKTNTPILFLHLKGNKKLWPKGSYVPRPGLIELTIGPVHPPAPVEEVEAAYKKWVRTVDPNVEFEEATEQKGQISSNSLLEA